MMDEMCACLGTGSVHQVASHYNQKLSGRVSMIQNYLESVVADVAGGWCLGPGPSLTIWPVRVAKGSQMKYVDRWNSQRAFADW
jgi:hypothetical protein